MRGRWFAATFVIAFVIAGPAMAAPGFTPSFRVAGAAGTPVMAPDGTVAFPTFAIVEGTPRTAVQVRSPGGPLADLQVLDPTGTGTVPSVDAGGDGRIVAAWVDAGDVEVATLMPGSTTFAPTTTLTDDTAETAGVKVDGAGNAYVVWTTRDDVIPGPQRQVRARITTLPAGGGAPSTELNETFVTASAVHPTLALAFDVNDAGDMVFVKQRGTFDTGTGATTLDYEGWTRPAGGSATPVTPLVTTSYNGNVDSNGESTVTSLNVDINEAGAVMASWYKYAFTTLDSVDVVNGTAASGFGSISNPTLGGHLARTTVTSVLDSGGRTTVAVLMEEAVTNKLRTHVFTRSPAGVWSSGQKPMPTGEHNYGNELAADRSGRVMLVFQVHRCDGGGLRGDRRT